MFRAFFAVLFAVLYLILGIPVLFVEWLIGKKNPEKRDLSSLHLVQWAFRVICKICGVKTTVIGHENVPVDQPVLYVANHNSYFDIIITYSLCPTLTGYIAKDAIEKVPLLKTWMERLYCLFLKRGDLKQNLKVMIEGMENVKKGISMTIFPEGTRGTSEEMLPFKEGSLKIAEKTGCAIIPIAISNTKAIVPKLKPLTAVPTHVVVEYGAPIYPKDLPKEQKKMLGKITQDVIQNMLDKNKALI